MKRLFIIITAFTLSANAYTQFYADSVINATFGGINNARTNLIGIIGEPDYNSSIPESFVALGGGTIIIDCGITAINGDGIDLRVYEIGASYPGAESEPFYLLGNVQDSVAGWRYLGYYPGDICDVDFDDYNVDEIRYLCIMDGDPENAITAHETPGADIDAVEILNYQSLSVNNSPEVKFDIAISPNPTKSTVTIFYQLISDSKVKIDIVDFNGQLVENLIIDNQKPGKYTLEWGGIKNSKVNSGLYFCRINVNNKVINKKILCIE